MWHLWTKMRVSMGYPPIKGPRSVYDRIAIIGAGMSGVHMASLLKERGYKNIKVFEERQEVGGKAYSRFYRGVWMEFGAAFLSEIYDQIVNLLERYNVGFTVVSKSPISIWENDYEDTTVRDILIKRSGERTPQAALRSIQAAVAKYDRIHRCLFGNYSSELMPRPIPDVLHEIRGTFLDFLRRNDLLLLEPIFSTVLSKNGYGYLNQTSAIYGLVWVPPQSVNSAFKPENGIWLLRGGFQRLVFEIAKQNKLDIHFGVNIKNIHRIIGPSGIYITHTSQGDPKILRERFDFLILSPAMNSLFNIVDFNLNELKVFSTLVNSYIVATLIESDNGRRGRDPHMDFTTSIEPPYSVEGGINFYQAKKNITGDAHRLGIRENGPDGRPQETVMYQQYGFENPFSKDMDLIIQSKLFAHLRLFDKRNPKILEQIKWGYYFPRFPPKEADRGYHWDVLDMQGKFNTWYIGSSVCFESMESVVEYNNLLIKIAGM
ncbi:uncharacterized protein LOC133188131 [Saccostrea echinata]|uniref:uncharacterized protein LOC133188131 n=1 Tax=Saccostrea echinata TaxID=191078 RepID=UPI002A82DA1E|nr:uncharacterized protein LOC133188131 [Saccostrea echinata]